MSKIVVIGSLNMDLVVETPKLPELGETIKGSGFQTVPGGKGANQAYAVARLGGNVSMIGRVGEDSFGENLRKSLFGAGVDVSNVKTTEGFSTGIASITIYEGNNFIILDEGSNSAISTEDIDGCDEVISSADAILLQFEIPHEINEYIINKYKGKVPIILNPAPAGALTDELLNGLDYIAPNEIEAKQLTGIEINDQSEAFATLDFFRQKGVKFPMITLGAKGVAYFDGEKNSFLPANKVVPVDTTAAGDTFLGGFVTMRFSGKTMEQAIAFAQAAAAISITRKGAQSSIPTLQEVESSL